MNSTRTISAHGRTQSAAQVGPHPDQRPPIRLCGFEPRAHRELASLPFDEQFKTAVRIGAPVANRDCQLVTRLAAHRIFHFAIPGTRSGIRVSFRNEAQRPCVVHIGSHRAFDHFAQTYSGVRSRSFIPIEESEIMNKHAQSAKVNAHGPSMKTASVSASSDVHDCLTLLGEALLKVVGESHQLREQQWNADRAAARQTLDSFGELQQALAKRVAQHESQLEALRQSDKRSTATMEHRTGELADQLAHYRADLQQAITALAERWQAHADSWETLADGSHPRLKELWAAWESLGRECAVRRAEGERRWEGETAALRFALEAHRTAQSQSEVRLTDELASMHARAAAVTEAVREQAALSAMALNGQLAQLTESLADLNRRVAQIEVARAEPVPDTSWAGTMASAVHGWISRIVGHSLGHGSSAEPAVVPVGGSDALPGARESGRFSY
ncbi:MAG: hypothetical protein AB7U20_22130 [Planctomycetaceae bacterium]